MTSDDEVALRVRALESLLLEKGLVEAPAIDEIIDLFENRLGPQNGARVVARAWSDPAFKDRLLSNPTDAIVELGFEAVQGEDMVVVENTAAVHNIVVCTLCSC
ncbi:MAG: nitrile hydratase subunit alpha, partial [Rhodospirillaceae bacterium]|nr:nitrile hydratase subunit alpha [Rhodospirillaceae bacterium]